MSIMTEIKKKMFMQIIVKALEEIFKNSKTRIDLETVRCNVPSLNSEQLAKLGELTIIYNVEVKRSGTGLVVIVKSLN